MLYEHLLKKELQKFNETQKTFFYEVEKVERAGSFQSIVISEKWKDDNRIYRQYKFENEIGIYSYDDHSDVDF